MFLLGILCYLSSQHFDIKNKNHTFNILHCCFDVFICVTDCVDVFTRDFCYVSNKHFDINNQNHTFNILHCCFDVFICMTDRVAVFTWDFVLFKQSILRYQHSKLYI